MSKPRYCAQCATPVVERVGESGAPQFACPACGHVDYNNSRPCAGALVVDGGRLMLVRRGREPFKDWWDIPGGFLDPGEPPEAGAVREVREETGLDVRPTALFGIYPDTYGDSHIFTLNLMYLAVPIGGTPRPADDAVEIGWFGPDELPENVAFRNGQECVADWQRYARGVAGSPAARVDHDDQRRVASFVARYDLDAPPEARVLDLVSEVGELAKEVLIATRYGREPLALRPAWSDELGDAYFALLALANRTNVDLRASLDRAVTKYAARLDRSGDASSGR